MQIQEIPPLQTFDANRKLHRVAQDQVKAWTMEGTAKGLRTDGVAPCIVLCALISDDAHIVFGMYHWSGSDNTAPEKKQKDAEEAFKKICQKTRKEARKQKIDDDKKIEIVFIGCELATENSSGTEIEQIALQACLNEENTRESRKKTS